MARLYISGPVTDKPDDNHAAFRDAQYSLRAARYETLDPHIIVPQGFSHDEAMIVCIDELTRHMWSERPMPCYDGLALLPGWEQSEGARLEKAVAEACGIPVKTVEEWIEEAPL